MKRIDDPAAPEYFADSFPADSFPRYAWLDRPKVMSDRVWMSETTHRDGQQGGLPLTAEQSLAIYDIMCEFTGDSGAIRHAEFFVYRPHDRAALEGALERYRGGAPIEPTTWLRAKREDVQLISKLGISETGLLSSCSDYHVFHKFKPGGRVVAAERYLDAIGMTLDAGIRPRVHLEDTTRSSIDFVLQFVEAVLERARDYGPGLQPRFRICDTLGLGLPYDDVDLPRSVPRIFQAFGRLGLSGETLEFHPHNDTHLVVANCLAAIRNGCGVISGTCLGKGERTGNAPLEAVLMHLIGMGYFAGKQPTFQALNKLADIYAEMGHALPRTYPLYGRDAYRTRAGIHADGLNKFWWMYAPFNSSELVGRPLEVTLTRDSGAAGLIYLIKQHRGIELSKNDSRLHAIQRWVDEQYADGRVTGIEWEEVAHLVEQHIPA
jgi:2-phosphinomethylmalic acid synthase